MQVSGLMSTPPVTVGPDATLHEAIEVMLQNRVGSAVVVADAPVGILTRSDALRAAYAAGAELDAISVTRGMSDDLVTTDPDTTARKALRLMESHEIKKLPVVTDFDLVGIITMTDIAQHLPEHAKTIQARIERSDDWVG